jgi:membrane-bound lytic murein transglycosylase A
VFTPEDPRLGAIGAGKTQLTPLRSLAIDKQHWAYGTPIWLETEIPSHSGSESFHRLLIAQDTGSAIRGRARGDIYFGWGDEAAFKAGQMQAKARMVVLLPKFVA